MTPCLFRAKAGALLLALASCTVGACAGSDCISGVGAPGVLLSVRDSLTGVLLDSISIVTVVRLTNKLAPNQPDSVRGSLTAGSTAPRGPLSITDDHPARYRILVEAPRYLAWEKSVDVERACTSVRTILLVALLHSSS